MKHFTISFRQFFESGYRDDGQGNTFWSGSQGASGILPICTTTKRICLAWRSRHVHIGNCWGTIGGAIEEGSTPQANAIDELREETGYNGALKTIPAYIFKSGTFQYFNFLGLVPEEFEFMPSSGHSWETDKIMWMNYQEFQAALKRAHPGLVALYQHSKGKIEQVLSDENHQPQGRDDTGRSVTPDPFSTTG